MNNQYRVENKTNVCANGKKTSFYLFERAGVAFVCAGNFTARGWDRTDEQCIAAARETIDQFENE